jgi:hypothetical protein
MTFQSIRYLFYALESIRKVQNTSGVHLASHRVLIGETASIEALVF